MIRRAYSLGLLIVGLLTLASAAQGQVPVIQNADKASGSVTDQQIKDYINYYLPALSGDDTPARETARQQLVAGVKGAMNAPPAASYLLKYAETLDTALQPLVKDANLAHRVNAAVVVKRVAEQTNNRALAPSVLALLQDQNEGIQIWALRAARYVLPASLNNDLLNKQTPTLIPQIHAALKMKPTGAVAMEAYNALSLNVREPKATVPVTPQMILAVVPELHKAMQIRIEQYQAGKVSDSLAERDACNTLVNVKVWDTQTAALKTASLQSMLDLMYAMAQLADGGSPAKAELADAIKDAAKAVKSLDNKLNNPALSTALNPLVALNPQALSAAQKLTPLVQAVGKAMQTTDKAIKLPTTAPATQPK